MASYNFTVKNEADSEGVPSIPDRSRWQHRRWSGLDLLCMEKRLFAPSFNRLSDPAASWISARHNSWFYGYPNAAEDAASRGENLNRVLSAQCRALKVPFEPLKDPEVFKLKDRDWETSQGKYLITDHERRRVYVVLRWG